MPSLVISTPVSPITTTPTAPAAHGTHGITKLTNCRVVRGDELVWEDLWVSAVTGKIVRSQAAFYDDHVLPDAVVDLGGRIVAPGFIECQLNGAFGFNFSTLYDDESGVSATDGAQKADAVDAVDAVDGVDGVDGVETTNGAPAGTTLTMYEKRLRALNRRLVQTGVTSYVPTVTSQTPALYRAVLPHLAPRRGCAADGAESLGAHIEGPFLSPTKNGVHNVEVLRIAESFADIEAMYGAANLTPGPDGQPPAVCMMTAAPELGRMTDVVFPELRRRGIVCAIGHSEATYEQAAAAIAHGASMITHLFNAMRPLHHRNPGIFGVLGETSFVRVAGPTVVPSPAPSAHTSDATPSDSGSSGSDAHPLFATPARPFFGVIADGNHLHPTTVKIAYNAHPSGFILVTDAMHMVGLPDGPYDWTNGARHMRLVKTGRVLLLEGSDTIAGSTITLVECLEHFVNWTGASLPQALRTVTSTPAAMLGLQGVKGSLEPDADADLVVLAVDETIEPPSSPTTAAAVAGGNVVTTHLQIDEVWKLGQRVFQRKQ